MAAGFINVNLKFINQAALEYQLNVEQPSFWEILKVSVLFTFIVETSQLILVYFSQIPTGIAYPIFRVTWVVGIFAIWTTMVLAFKHEYPKALKIPRKSVRNEWHTDGIILLFAVLFLISYAIHTWKLNRNILDLVAIASSLNQNPLMQQTVVSVFKLLWQPVNFGTDILGVVLGSINILLCPFYEELFFRGYMITSLCQRFHPLTAVCFSAFLFAACHIFSKSLEQIPVIFLLGVCCGLIRLWSGRWQDAWKLHFFYNYCIIVPKIVFAVFRFHTAP
jgi:membrane protease YdiL (CAAX protease family)